MSRRALVLTLAASLVSGCVRPIFDGRSVAATGAATAAPGAPAATTTDARGADDDAHTRAFGI